MRTILILLIALKMITASYCVGYWCGGMGFVDPVTIRLLPNELLPSMYVKNGFRVLVDGTVNEVDTVWGTYYSYNPWGNNWDTIYIKLTQDVSQEEEHVITFQVNSPTYPEWETKRTDNITIPKPLITSSNNVMYYRGIETKFMPTFEGNGTSIHLLPVKDIPAFWMEQRGDTLIGNPTVYDSTAILDLVAVNNEGGTDTLTIRFIVADNTSNIEVSTPQVTHSRQRRIPYKIYNIRGRVVGYSNQDWQARVPTGIYIVNKRRMIIYK